MKKAGIILLLLLSLVSLSVASTTQMSLNVLAAQTSLDASKSLDSPQIYGAPVLFTCSYSDINAEAALNSSCSLVINGRHSRATRAGVDHTYGEILEPGVHSWYCSCSAAGYESKESSPQLHNVLPARDSVEARLETVEALEFAENALVQAKTRGEETDEAETALSEAKSALEQGNFRLANALVSGEDTFTNAFTARDRITDLGILLIPTFFLGVLVVIILFMLMRK